MMARQLDFLVSPKELRSLIQRQEGLCALTGEPLNETFQLHHVVPAGHGGRRGPEEDAFVSDPFRNGVLLNHSIDLDHSGAVADAGPHIIAHAGSFARGALAPHGSFKYSHGSRKDAHEDWARQGEIFAATRIWARIDGGPHEPPLPADIESRLTSRLADDTRDEKPRSRFKHLNEDREPDRDR